MLAFGFDHVSDDDYARVTIAQSFAHAPKLDPSGTSWLPFPFWALGSVMMAAGRSLAVARGASVALASLAVAVLYVALRTAGSAGSAGSTRPRAILAVAFAALSPWSVWLGAATVPESFTASLTAAAVIALGASGSARSGWARVGFALGLCAACLSRYEVWPAAALLAVVLAVRALRDARGRERRLELVVAAIAAVGPLLWIAWNAYSHGDALHFFVRVSRFKRAIGEGSSDTLEAVLLYPRLLATMRPDVLVATLLAVVLAARSIAVSRVEVQRRWLVPLLCAAAQIAFLAYGNARDGAPAHHSERALLGVVFITAAFAADVIAEAAPAVMARARGVGLAGAVVAGGAWLATSVVALRDVPGTRPAEDRSPQIATGKSLRAAQAPQLDITPCAYEHFAVIAAFGAPERVTTHPATSAALTTACPSVERR